MSNNGSGNKGIPIRCSHYILILTLSGGSIRHANQHNYTILPHSLQLLPPGTIHSFEDTEPDSDFLILLFDWDFLSKEYEELLFFHNREFGQVDLDGIEFTRVLETYKQLDLEYKNKKKDYKEISKVLLVQLLYLLKREKQSKPKEIILNRAQQITSRFLCLIEEHFIDKKSVREYADILEITSKHLSETIKESLSESALTFIHARIIKEIQYLLCYSDMSIKQIALYLNFENSSEFGRFFKRYEGLSPKAFQLKFRN